MVSTSSTPGSKAGPEARVAPRMNLCPARCLKYTCLLAGDIMEDGANRHCLAGLAPEVCRWLRGWDGTYVILFLERHHELSTAALAIMLGYVDEHGEIIPGWRYGIKTKLDALYEVQIIAKRLDPSDSRIELYSLGPEARNVVKQCRSHLPDLDTRYTKEDRELAARRKKLDRIKVMRSRWCFHQGPPPGL